MQDSVSKLRIASADAPPRAEPPPPGTTSAWRARRALDRLAFGPSPGDVERVAALGPETWVASQLQAPAPPPERVSEAATSAATAWRTEREMRPRGRGDEPREPGDEQARRDARRMRREMARNVSRELLSLRLERALSGDHPLFESMVDFWGNHFHVFARKGGPEPFLLPSYEVDVLRRNALGHFGELLAATARHPAMLYYLDNWRSAAPDAARKRTEPARSGRRRPRRARTPDGLNENYARELLELHSIGTAAFEQRDVEEVARAFTGWTLRRERDSASPMPMRFYFDATWHDGGPKTVLGRRLPEGGGVRDGERVLALLAQHPATARHIARKLAVRFIADDPSAAVVDRGAARFLETNGDIRATLRAVLLGGDELFDPTLHKMKTPFELVVSSLRATGARVVDPRSALGALRGMGQLPYLAPTPAGFPDTAQEWIDPGAVLERTRFAFALSANRLPGIQVGSALDDLDPAHLLASAPRTATRRALTTPDLTRRERVALALAAPEFQLR